MATRDQRRARLRNVIRGTDKRPRLVVFRSNRYLYGQIVDDRAGKTVVSVERVTDPVLAGKEIAEKAGKRKITRIVFDRAGYKYHGKVKAFADAARGGGLKF